MRLSPSCGLEQFEPRILLSATLYVDVNSPGPTHDGSTWDSAYVGLQPALGAAVSGDQILVADGIYKPTSGTRRTISSALKSGVAILGGYAGASDLAAARNVALYPTDLSGDIVAAINRFHNSYHIAPGGATLGGAARAPQAVIAAAAGNAVTSTYQQGVNGYTGTTDVSITSQGGGNGSANYTGPYVRVYTSTSYSTEDILSFTNLGDSGRLDGDERHPDPEREFLFRPDHARLLRAGSVGHHGGVGPGLAVPQHGQRMEHARRFGPGHGRNLGQEFHPSPPRPMAGRYSTSRSTRPWCRAGSTPPAPIRASCWQTRLRTPLLTSTPPTIPRSPTGRS